MVFRFMWSWPISPPRTSITIQTTGVSSVINCFPTRCSYNTMLPLTKNSSPVACAGRHFTWNFYSTGTCRRCTKMEAGLLRHLYIRTWDFSKRAVLFLSRRLQELNKVRSRTKKLKTCAPKSHPTVSQTEVLYISNWTSQLRCLSG